MSKFIVIDINKLATLVESEMGPAFVNQVGLLVQEAIPKTAKNAHYTFSFGKYRGETYMDVYAKDADYINWLMQWKDLREGTRQSLQEFCESMRS